MDENKNDQITELLPEINRFSGRVAAASSQDNILVSAQRAAAIQARKQAESQAKLGQAISNTTSQLVSFSSGLTGSSGTGSFSSVNKVVDITTKMAGSLASMIPVVGGAFQGVIEGAGEVAKFMVGQFAKAYGNFERLSDTGVVTTFEDMKSSARSTGLNLDDTAKIFSKYSKEMAAFGGAAVLGRKRVDMIMFESKEVSRQYQNIGMSVTEFAETQVQYISQLQRSGGIKGKTDKEIRDGSIRYIEMLDNLSKTTGITRTELKNQIDERMRNSRYLAGVASLGEKQRTQIDKVLAQFAATGDKELEEGMQDLIAANGRVTTDKAKAAYLALSQGGMDVAEEISKLRGPASDAADFMNKSTKAAAIYSKENKELISNIGANTLLTRPAIGMANLAIKQELDIRKIEQANDDARKKALEETTTDGSKLGATRRSLYESGKTMELLATDSKLVTSVMSTLASGMDKATSAIYSSIGEKLPPYLQLRKEENESIQKTVKLQNERVETQNRLTKLKEETEEEKKDPKSRASRELRRYNNLKAKEAESEIGLLTAQIKQEEFNTEEIRKKRITAENTPGGGTPPSPSHPSPRPEPSSGSSGSSSGAPSSGTSGSQSGQSHPGPRDSSGDTSSSAAPVGATPNPSAPGLGARESELNTLNQSGSKNQGIGVIRDMIASVESIGGSYNSLFGGGTKTPLTSMTINEVLKHQAGMIQRGAKSTAAGRYQFMSYTLPEYARKAKFDFGTTKFDERTQDALADILIREKGYDRYKKGQITDKQFLANLSKAWAGLPNPEKGGRSNYAGDGLNASHMKVENALGQIRQARTGGIFSGPSTGYLAELHGDEAVIPANDGMAKQQIQNALSGDTGGKSGEDMSKIFKMMTQKINSMISIANDGVGIQKKAKKANVTMA